MTTEHLLRLFDYDLWANERVLEALNALAPLSPDSSLARLFSHLIAAQQVWLQRIGGQSIEGMKAWPETDPGAWPGLLQTTRAAWRAYLTASSTDMEACITYHNTQGQVFETPLFEIIIHVIIHGQHHRAQIATHLRALGHVPPPTDYIFFTRSITPG